MSNAIIIGWNRPVPGRERDANELFASSIAYWNKQKQAGNIDSFEPVLLGAHGGDMNGLFLVRGQPAKLDALMHTDELLDIVVRANLLLQGFGVNRAYTNDALQRLMERWTKHIGR